MKLVCPDIAHVFDLAEGRINSLVIENQTFLLSFLSRFNAMIDGEEGNFVLSDGDAILPLAKKAEFLSQFFPFEKNSRKTLLTKLGNRLEQLIADSFYVEWIDLSARINDFVEQISQQIESDIEWNPVDAGAILKAVNISFREDYDSLCESVLCYLSNVIELEGDKCFVLFNFRGLVSATEFSAFADTILRRGYNVLFVDNCEYPRVENEKRVIIDMSLCEIY